MDKVLEEQLIKHYHRLVKDFQFKPPLKPWFVENANFSNEFKQEVIELVNKLNKDYEKTNQQTI